MHVLRKKYTCFFNGLRALYVEMKAKPRIYILFESLEACEYNCKKKLRVVIPFDLIVPRLLWNF